MSDSDPPDDDFAALFAASLNAKPLARGQTVTGTIVAIGADAALVDVGAKGEASMAVDELNDEAGVAEFKIGDRIEATIISTMGGITLSRRLQRGAATRRQIEDAWRARLPVEGKVDSQVKGGYSVTIARQRAFCPASQIDIVRDTDPAAHLGRVYGFRIVEYGDNGRKFVVSRRALQEDEQQTRAAEVRKSLEVGAIVTGRVVSVREFGAFIDVGAGVQGLLHVSEMGWTRIDNPSNVLKIGDAVTVKILRIDAKDGAAKIALGMKQLIDDPWSAVAHTLPPGTVVRGRVTRVADFGVFVELGPGIVGLLPGGEIGVARDVDLKKTFAIGASVDVIVLDVDLPARRIRLSVKAMRDAEEAAEVRDYAAREDLAAHASGFGSLADKLKGALKPRAK